MDILNPKTTSFQSQTFSAERHNIECNCKQNFEFTISHIISMYLSGELLSHFLPGDEHIIEGIKLKLDKLSSIPNDKLSLLSESIDHVILSFCAKLHQIPQSEILSKATRLKNSKITHSIGAHKCESPRMVDDIPIKQFGEKQEVLIRTESLGQMIEEEQAKGLPVLFILTRYFGNNEDQCIAWNLNEESLKVNKYPLHKRVEPYSKLRYKESAQELKLLNNFDTLFLHLRRAYIELCEITGKNELENPNEEGSLEKILIGLLEKIEKLKHIHKIIRKKCSIFKERLHEKEFNIGFKEGGREKTSEESKHTKIIWDMQKDMNDFCEKATQIPELENLSDSIATQENKESKEGFNNVQEYNKAQECVKDETSSHKNIKANIKTKYFEAELKYKENKLDVDGPGPETVKSIINQDEVQIDKTVASTGESKKIYINESSEIDRKMNINVKSFSARLARGSENQPENFSQNIDPNNINEEIEEDEKIDDKSFANKEGDKKSKEIKKDSEEAKIKPLVFEKYQTREIDAPIDESEVGENFVDKGRDDKSEIVKNSLEETENKSEIVKNSLEETENKSEIVKNSLEETENKREIVKNSLEETENKSLDSIKNEAREVDVHIGEFDSILEKDKLQDLIENASKEKETESELQDSLEYKKSLDFEITNTVKFDKTSFEVSENNEVKDAKLTAETGNEKQVIKATEESALLNDSQIPIINEKNKDLNDQIKKTVEMKCSFITEKSKTHNSSLLNSEKNDLSQNVSSMTAEIIEENNPVIIDLKLSSDVKASPCEINEKTKDEDLNRSNELFCSSEDKQRSIEMSIKKNSKVKATLEEEKEDTKFEKLLYDKKLEENKENELDKKRGIKTKLSKSTKEIGKTKNEKSQLFDEEAQLIPESPTISEEVKLADEISNPKEDLIENQVPGSEENIGSDQLDHLRKIQTLMTKRIKQINKPKIEIPTSEPSDQDEENSESNTPEENKSVGLFDALRELKTRLTKRVRQVIKKKTIPKDSSTIESKNEMLTPNEINQNFIENELPINEAEEDLQREIVDEGGKKRKLTTKLQKKTKFVLKKIKAINAFGKVDKSDPPTPYEVGKTASLSSLREAKTPSPLPEDADLSFPNRSEGKRRTQL
ncbi:unnamed protein product [Blepharisma stoltei]|uniref:Uncharacterized protein n=1 Tax=Blepharisma stoltei TaxID=1481888 RepID=A0AAU9J4R4_9CILI|nr:unnamed protein product [Blepharisma stoltei]